MNRPYKKSKIIKNLVPWDKDPRAIGTKILAEMWVTLHAFGLIKGIFIATSNFPKSAYEFVESIEHKIILIDGERLTNLMFEF